MEKYVNLILNTEKSIDIYSYLFITGDDIAIITLNHRGVLQCRTLLSSNILKYKNQ